MVQILRDVPTVKGKRVTGCIRKKENEVNLGKQLSASLRYPNPRKPERGAENSTVTLLDNRYTKEIHKHQQKNNSRSLYSIKNLHSRLLSYGRNHAQHKSKPI